MQGHPEITKRLNELLTYELGAMEVYMIQASVFENMGYARLHARLYHEAQDERAHAEKLIERLVFLESIPDLSSRPSLPIGTTPREMLEHDLRYEYGVVKQLNELMALAREHGDNGTRSILEPLLDDTEMDHVLWLETQLRLMSSLGEEAYLAEQITGGQPVAHSPA